MTHRQNKIEREKAQKEREEVCSCSMFCVVSRCSKHCSSAKRSSVAPLESNSSSSRKKSGASTKSRYRAMPLLAFDALSHIALLCVVSLGNEGESRAGRDFTPACRRGCQRHCREALACTGVDDVACIGMLI